MRSQGAEGDKSKYTEQKGEEADMKNTEPRCEKNEHQRALNKNTDLKDVEKDPRVKNQRSLNQQKNKHKKSNVEPPQ